MFSIVIFQVPIYITIDKRTSGDHFGRQQSITTDDTMKVTTMPISPIHHRCNTEAIRAVIAYLTRLRARFIYSIQLLFYRCFLAILLCFLYIEAHQRRIFLKCAFLMRPYGYLCMATITKYTTKAGKSRYKADIRIRKEGKIIHRESKSFERKRLAEEWARIREVQLQEHGELDKLKFKSITVADLISRYIIQFEPEDGFGRTKAFDLKKLQNFPLSELPAVSLTPKDLIDHAHYRKSTGTGPATIGNDYIWLSGVFKAIKASEGIPLDITIFDDARVILRQHNMIKRSNSRTRRPTKEELWKLSRYFWRKQYCAKSIVPMLDIMWFQLYSTRRDAETCRLLWSDNNDERQTGLVRDAKHPTAKKGNHKRFKYSESAWKIVQKQPRNNELIFPYNPRTVSNYFAKACKLLGIADLRLHDLRHEGVSRLFESGYSIEQVALFSLHEDWKTLKRYTHLRPEDL
jgi:integrase